jgi:hypothetical protein
MPDVKEPFTGPEIAEQLNRCPRHQTGLGFGPLFVMVPPALYTKVHDYLMSEGAAALEGQVESPRTKSTA